jgi:hypothetical protein
MVLRTVLVLRCPEIRTVKSQTWPNCRGIDMLEGDVWGHRKDLDEYFTVEDGTLEEIRTLAASGASAEEVANQVQKKARIGPELIKYIAKTKITA